MVEGTNLPPTIQTSMNFRNFVAVYMYITVLNLRCTFQWCRWMFPNFSMSKVEKPWKGLFRTDVIKSKKIVVC